MTGFDFLVVDKSIASSIDLVSGPSCISSVSEIICCSNEHGSWKLFNLLDVNSWWLILSILLLIDLFAPIKEFPCLSLHHLTIVDQTLNACTSWKVSHVHLESNRIVQFWILGNQESFSKLTNLRKYSTCNLCSFG